MPRKNDTTDIMFVPTYINKSGMRTLVNSNQRRCFKDTREEAQALLDAMLNNNSDGRIAEIFGNNPRFEVREVECYPGGDAKGIWFD